MQLSGERLFFLGGGKFDIWFLLFLQDCRGREQKFVVVDSRDNGDFNQDLDGYNSADR